MYLRFSDALAVTQYLKSKNLAGVPGFVSNLLFLLNMHLVITC